MTLRQQVLCGDTLCFDALVVLAALRLDGRPARLPADLRERLQAELG